MENYKTCEVFEKIKEAFLKSLKEDRYLLDVSINERSLTHKLAEYIQKEFPGWDVDCEYNRNGLNPKKLKTLVKDTKTDDTEGDTVFPDIIIHKRGQNNNLVVIEAKKSSNTNSRDNDENKLKAYKKDLGYKYALKIIFPVQKEIVNEENIKEYIKTIDSN